VASVGSQVSRIHRGDCKNTEKDTDRAPRAVL
jgi:hypothetical protein